MEANTLQEIISRAADSYGSQTAFRYKVKRELEEKTYEDLHRDTMAFGRMLEEKGMRGKHIAVIGPTSYGWITSYFGAANSKSVAVPIDVQLPAEAVCELLNRADVEMLVFDEVRTDVAEAAASSCPKIRESLSIQSLPELLEAYQGEFHCEVKPEDLCTILFTSGTTGKSKGVMLTHRNLADNALCLDMKIPQGTVSLTVLPINHVYCLTMDIIKGISIGMIICINDSIMRFQRNLKLFQPEIVLLVPMIIESLAGKLKEIDRSVPKEQAAAAIFGGKLKTICSGGAYLDPDCIRLFKEFGITILQGYGMTECSPVISTNLEWENKIGSVGKLLPNCEAKTVDHELWVRGSSVMQGYYKMPEETAAALEDGWLKTGDLGYVDEDRFVFLTGRRKNLIILANGENVSPEELENELGRNDLVKEILVREHEKVIEAEIFPDPEYMEKHTITEPKPLLQELVDRLNGSMPVYKRIARLIVREVPFERTAAGKIKRF